MPKVKAVEAQYVLLIRHGERDKPYDLDRADHTITSSDYVPTLISQGHRIADREMKGRPRTLSLAGWVAEVLAQRNITVCAAFSSPHLHAQQTTEAYLEALNPQGLYIGEPFFTDDQLKPEAFWFLPRSYWKTLRAVKQANNRQAILICGHQPHLTWIANWITGRSQPLPLGQSECVCLSLPKKGLIHRNGHILWAVSATNEKLTKRLIDKIKSKMDIAKFFVGFITLMLGIVLRNVRFETQPTLSDWVGFVGAFAVLIAGALSACTMLAYDQLLMPSNFWGGRARRQSDYVQAGVPQRPPSQTHWVLYAAMVRIWHRLFIPAVLLLGVGTAAIAYSLVKPPISLTLAASGIAILLLLVWIHYSMSSPALGFDD